MKIKTFFSFVSGLCGLLLRNVFCPQITQIYQIMIASQIWVGRRMKKGTRKREHGGGIMEKGTRRREFTARKEDGMAVSLCSLLNC